jgi:hypothetical protein
VLFCIPVDLFLSDVSVRQPGLSDGSRGWEKIFAGGALTGALDLVVEGPSPVTAPRDGRSTAQRNARHEIAHRRIMDPDMRWTEDRAPGGARCVVRGPLDQGDVVESGPLPTPALPTRDSLPQPGKPPAPMRRSAE